MLELTMTMTLGEVFSLADCSFGWNEIPHMRTTWSMRNSDRSFFFTNLYSDRSWSTFIVRESAWFFFLFLSFLFFLSFFLCKAGYLYVYMRPYTLFDGVLFVKIFFSSLKCIDGNCHFGILMTDIHTPCSSSVIVFLLSCVYVYVCSYRFVIFIASPFHRVCGIRHQEDLSGVTKGSPS